MNASKNGYIMLADERNHVYKWGHGVVELMVKVVLYRHGGLKTETTRYSVNLFATVKNSQTIKLINDTVYTGESYAKSLFEYTNVLNDWGLNNESKNI